MKYVVSGGWVKSANDGDHHYIGPVQVAKLYNLPPGSWRVYNEHDHGAEVLRPRDDGKYYDATKGDTDEQT